MKKKIVLPEKAFPHDKVHVIGLHTFTDGFIVLNDDDAARVAPMFKSFYGATVEDIADPVEPTNPDEPDGAKAADLTSKQTKTEEKA